MSLIINTFKATEESQPFSHPLRTNGFLNRKQIKSPIKVQIMRVFLKIMSVFLKMSLPDEFFILCLNANAIFDRN